MKNILMKIEMAGGTKMVVELDDDCDEQQFEISFEGGVTNEGDEVKYVNTIEEVMQIVQQYALDLFEEEGGHFD